MNIRSIQVHDLITIATASHDVLVLRVCEIEIASAGDGQSIAEFATTIGGAGYTLRATSPHESTLTRWSAPTWTIANDGSSTFADVELLGWQHHGLAASQKTVDDLTAHQSTAIGLALVEALEQPFKIGPKLDALEAVARCGHVPHVDDSHATDIDALRGLIRSAIANHGHVPRSSADLEAALAMLSIGESAFEAAD